MEIKSLIRLCDLYGKHQGITHWGVSMRARRKGDFFDRLKSGKDVRTRTASAVGEWFSKNWPSDLPWPEDIPRPGTKKMADGDAPLNNTKSREGAQA